MPSFTAVLYGRVAPGFPLEQMFATARIVMGRRGKEFTEAEEQLYLDLYEQTRLERERAFQRPTTAAPTAGRSPRRHGPDRDHGYCFSRRWVGIHFLIAAAGQPR